MKAHQKLASALIALLVISNAFPVLAMKPNETSGTIATEDISSPSDSAPSQESPSLPDNTLLLESSTAAKEESSSPTNETSQKEQSGTTAAEADMPVPDESFIFSASLEYSPQGWRIQGFFEDFPSDTVHIQILYSLDGKSYQACGREWDLSDIQSLKLTETQRLTCLYYSNEPLKSYLAEKLDRFYLKLCLTRENGITYETQAAIIERQGKQPVPQGIQFYAIFAPAILVRETRPYVYYGRYQLTIPADTTKDEISALLPSTLPVKIQLVGENNLFGECIIDCPVSWKPLSLPPLIAGESITILDAVEDIVVPEGILLHTQVGVFELNEPLSLNHRPSTDEVRLILNVIPQDENPTGVLADDWDGLKIAFHQKPTGATAIRAYTLSEGETKWTELPDLSLHDITSTQLSTANSGYALVLSKTTEPYRSWLAAEAAGNKPVPFLVGIKIEGGVYDGKQLILPWPSSYKLPPNLPDLMGSGGNEGNAGADNKPDSTEDGQRPNLPQPPEEKPNGQQPDLPKDPTDTPNEQQPVLPEDPTDKPNGQQPELPEDPVDKPIGQQPELPEDPVDKPIGQRPELPEDPVDKPNGQQPDLPKEPMNRPNGQQPDLPKEPVNKPYGQQPDLPKEPVDKSTDEPYFPKAPVDKSIGQQPDLPKEPVDKTAEQQHFPKDPADSPTEQQHSSRDPKDNTAMPTAPDPLPLNGSSQEDQQSQENIHTFDPPDESASSSVTAHTFINTRMEGNSSAAAPSALSNVGGENNLWEKPDRNTGNKEHTCFLFLATAAISGMCLAAFNQKAAAKVFCILCRLLRHK